MNQLSRVGGLPQLLLGYLRTEEIGHVVPGPVHPLGRPAQAHRRQPGSQRVRAVIDQAAQPVLGT